MKKYQNIILIIGFSLTLIGCVTLGHNYYSGIQPPMTIKQKVKCFIKYIATSEEKDNLEYLETDEELNNYLVDFWKKRDTDTTTIENEYKNHFVKRFTYANNYLGGWQTDRARIFILHGSPDELINETMNNLPANIYTDYEVWVYDKPTLHPQLVNIFSTTARGKVKFVFANRMGFGVKEQIYSTEDNEKVDARVYRFFTDH
jgi:GWxTD domain-containing protein